MDAREIEGRVARAIFNIDWLGTVDGNKEAVWLMNRSIYHQRARAALSAIAPLQYRGCLDEVIQLGIQHVRDKDKPCKGTNINVCVAEGCFSEACLNLIRKD